LNVNVCCIAEVVNWHRIFKKHQKKLKQYQTIITGKSKKRKIRTGAIENLSDYKEMVQTDDDDELEQTNNDESEWIDDDESEQTDDKSE
jgi:hypothetical protein